MLAGRIRQTVPLSHRVLTLVFSFQWFLHWFSLNRCHANAYVYCTCVSYGYVRVPGKITSTREGVGHSGHFWISGGLWLESGISEAQRPNTDPEHSGVCLNPPHKQHIHF